MSAVRDRTARAQSSRNVHGFSQLGFSYARCDRLFAVYLDAVGTLSRERDSDRHQLFVLLGNRAVGEREFVPGAKRVHCFRREFANVSELTDI